MQELFEASSVTGIVALLDSSPQPAAAKLDAAVSAVASDTELPLTFSSSDCGFSINGTQTAPCTISQGAFVCMGRSR